MSEDIGFLEIAELGARYRDGRLTPIDVVRHALARIDCLEPSLNAFANPMAEMALADAEKRTSELASGLDLGPLHGIPVAIKDLIDVEGVPTGFGTRAREPQMATRDAELVGRLRAAGAIILGKTNLLEYAYGVAHPDIGQTNNPHNTGRTSGGSSGGSAAAVAGGIVPLAIGTDTGGSIRIPASYCGIVGLKPSFRLVSLDGVFPLSWSLDHAGPLARNVADAMIGLAAIADIDSAPQRDIAGLRIGLIDRHFGSHEITPGVREALDAALALLKARGAELVPISIVGLERVNTELVTVLHPEASVIHRDLLRQNPLGYAPVTRAQLEDGFKTTAADYLLAMRYRETFRASVEATFAQADVLASPSVPFVAPRQDPRIEDGEEGEMLSSGFANVSGHPSISIPAGMSEGLPVGLQLTGPLGRDAALLAMAGTIERAVGAYRRPKS
ncbi:aspartyl-tRNA(Asn)/glutamyl-tRNA(Gln) amidotransferase subunit A [Devosia sp. UYZn731]|uniref:amidase n=1 Tax=Devosia sp. UYZn731 TaxID=3156345 RepID=UPI0033911D82